MWVLIVDGCHIFSACQKPCQNSFDKLILSSNIKIVLPFWNIEIQKEVTKAALFISRMIVRLWITTHWLAPKVLALPSVGNIQNADCHVWMNVKGAFCCNCHRPSGNCCSVFAHVHGVQQGPSKHFTLACLSIRCIWS